MICFTAMMMMSEIGKRKIEKDCIFIADYAAYMLGCGATCSRILRNINRMTATVSSKAEVTILPQHIIVTITSEDGIYFSHSRAIAHKPIDFNLNTNLSKLSWDVALGKLTLTDARVKFNDILEYPRYDPWMVLLAVAFANTAFCGLFGGDLVAMGIVAVATLIGYIFKIILSSKDIQYRIVVLICSFVSAILGTSGYVWQISSTPEVALATSILYLIPGIPYINSISDLLSDHYLCAVSRFISAVLITVCITIGLTVAFLIMKIGIFDL